MRLANLTLKGRVAVVTGGGQGIGRAIGLAMAQLGASVCIADIDPDAGARAASEIAAMGGRALAVRSDVTIAAQVAALADRCVADFGRIDILVNNAGGASGAAVRREERVRGQSALDPVERPMNLARPVLAAVLPAAQTT